MNYLASCCTTTASPRSRSRAAQALGLERGAELATGLGLALLLNGKSRVLDGAKTLLLIPMVLPPIVVALIWKIIYTPDVSRCTG